MPVTPRRIVSYINTSSSSFTANEIKKALSDEKSKIKKRRKKRIPGERNAIMKINAVLQALQSIDYVYRKRKTYFKAQDLPSGRIRINTSGNGIIITDKGDEILVKKQFLNRTYNNDSVRAEIIDYKNGIFFGRVANILERGREKYFARLERRAGKYMYFRLLDAYDKEACAEIPDDNVTGDFAEVKLIDGNISGIQGCVVERFFLDEEYDIRRIIIKHNLPGEHGEYPELRDIDKIINKESRGRKDYRDLFTITIDGERAKDFDDAISLEISGSGYVLYVHIADVSAFVKKHSELDREAYKRGTSYYLGNSVIPMLPEILSNDLCSLREGEERLTLSVEITFDNTGRGVKSEFYRGIIRVDRRLTYNQADEIMDSNGDRGLEVTLERMYRLARILKRNRLSAGRVDLDLPDYDLVYDNDNLKDIEFATRLRSHSLIEEFMLSANEAVSRILTGNNIPALYRIHENMSRDKVIILRDFLRSLGIKLKEMKNMGIALQNVIDEVDGREYEQVVNFIILKSFMQAYYGPKPLGHFGLGFPDYTHFTSPIRRYPDLIVHRCLRTLINKEPQAYETEELEEIGARSSETERIAQNAERDLFKLISCRFLQDRTGEVFDAVISGISRAGFFVMLMDKPIEGMVPLRFLTDDYYLVKEDEFTVTGRKSGKRYRIGDRLRVRLRDVFYDYMRIDFEPA